MGASPVCGCYNGLVAPVAELVDAIDLGSIGLISCACSNRVWGKYSLTVEALVVPKMVQIWSTQFEVVHHWSTGGAWLGWASNDAPCGCPAQTALLLTG